MSDLISREDAIEALKRAEALTKAFGFHNVIDTIREVPSAQPEPKRGEWEVIDAEEPRRYGCSHCHILSWNMSNFCPNCGADMRGGDAE